MSFPDISRMAIVKGTGQYMWMTITSYPRRLILNLLRSYSVIVEVEASISVQSDKQEDTHIM